MRLGGKGLEFLAGELGIGYGEELFFDAGLGGEVGIAEDGLRCGRDRLRCGLGGNQCGNQDGKEQEGKRIAEIHG